MLQNGRIKMSSRDVKRIKFGEVYLTDISNYAKIWNK